MDLGVMVEGFVELDSRSGRMVLRVPQSDGSDQYLDVQTELARHQGKEVRFICTPMAAIAELARLVEAGH